MSYAIVTGASRGIGRATALALAARGVDVALLARSRDALQQVAEESRAFGVRAHLAPCDLSCADDIRSTISDILQSFSAPPLVVVNNAGVIHRDEVHALSLEAWQKTLDVNLTAPFLITRAALPAMLQAKKGRIIQVASISATLGTARASAYCASKWGLVGFTKSLAEELRGTGLITLSVLPGSVDTAMLVGSGFDPQMTPEDVASTIVYAALDAPDAMNGSSIEIFG